MQETVVSVHLIYCIALFTEDLRILKTEINFI